MTSTLQTFLAGLAGAALGLVAGALLFQSTPAPFVPRAETDELLREVVRELGAVRAALASPQAEQLSAPQASQPTRHELPRVDGGELVAALGALEQGLATLGQRLEATQLGHGARALGSEPIPTKAAAVSAARAGLAPDQATTDPRWFALSPAQVHERLGTPSQVNNTADRVRWYYQEPGNTGYLIVTFIDGYVAYTQSTTEGS